MLFVSISNPWCEQFQCLNILFASYCQYNFNFFFLFFKQKSSFPPDLISMAEERERERDRRQYSRRFANIKWILDNVSQWTNIFLVLEKGKNMLTEIFMRLQHEFLIYIFISHVHFAVYHSGVYGNCVDPMQMTDGV